MGNLLKQKYILEVALYIREKMESITIKIHCIKVRELS
jgi:hypothetical protein